MRDEESTASRKGVTFVYAAAARRHRADRGRELHALPRGVDGTELHLPRLVRRASRTRSATTGSGAGPAPPCNIHEAPARNFDFDTDFQLVQNLPPLTPQVTSVRQILFTENFR